MTSPIWWQSCLNIIRFISSPSWMTSNICELSSFLECWEQWLNWNDLYLWMSMWHAKLSFLLRLTPVMSLSNSHVWCLFKLSLLVKLLHSVYSSMTCRQLTHWVYLFHHTHVGFHQPHSIFRSWGIPRTCLNMYQFVLTSENVWQTSEDVSRSAGMSHASGMVGHSTRAPYTCSRC